MTEYVVDAAAAVDALAGKGATGIALRSRLADSTCHAPHLIDAEVGHALRRALLNGEISEDVALTALRALPDLIENRYPHTPRLLEHAWGLRHNVTFYDALYVGLSALLDVPLLTGDARLAGAPALRCRVELIR
ncbi:type II toxin-antitoxin system VapC family toxin [Mycobacterium noviomagense]|uniref:Ribonuclease VapC n=1 Tax=Mycobacterium noviomagense TaxID=459858 RepID=A0A7I7PE03_9MYCO|nr:type II toxin-antitoxin system VapC family toxin [Mycobacterium noviomagense]ORB12770.1 VapC toxin family PIN domain ribonuclease [Mycobacterium noviomagense]BBY06801.1 ribonuclease VapC1 [Mycobacterium noviomagense]